MTSSEAAECYAALCDGGDATEWIAPADNVAEFLGELTSFYPAQGDLMDDVIDECVWAGPIDTAGDHVVLSITWVRSQEVSQLVVKLAHKYSLACYDPQKAELLVSGAAG